MARRLATAAVLTLGCMHTSVVAALGLGELKLESFLNEPLTATVDILNTGGLHEDQIRVRLATSEDFDKLGVDRAYFLTNIKFKITVDGQGRGKIIVTSEDPVLEPYLDFLIEARWPSGRLLREYTVLVDPPVFDNQAPLVSAQQRVSEVEGEPESAKKKTQTGAVNSGTHVKTHKSGLPPGQMPKRGFGSDASDTPLAGDQYMIQRDETLWGIALRAKPEGASVHQTMLDIQRLNPKAFIDGNINRIKAGYIIHLPSEAEISSDDLAVAQAEVQQQNQDWRDGVARSQDNSGASLRISAEPTAEQDSAGDDDGKPSSPAAGNDEKLLEEQRENGDLTERLTAMEQQVETLQRIVSLKDDQISALQTALTDTDPAIADDNATEGADASDRALELAKEAAESTAPAAQTEPKPVAEKPAAVQAPAAVAKPAPVKEEGSGALSYIIGLLVIAGLAVFFFLRRRGDSDSEDSKSEAASREVFADVKLQDSDVQLNAIEEPPEGSEPAVAESAVAPAVEAELDLELEPDIDSSIEQELEQAKANRGYGEHKHDEYASDETGDALAEADIYIAYGRYPQAIELLKTAIGNEPANPDYRLKLVELCVEMDNKHDALEQYTALQDIDDVAAVSRAQGFLRNASNGADWLADAANPLNERGSAPAEAKLELAPEMDLTADTGEPLEADFGELEIELPKAGDDEGEDDLDLSADFTDTAPIGGDEEDLVFAEGGNEMSTKLDLARAYLDMGDEDGAKQILQEVAAEGSSSQVEEAKGLLERLD
ncbi:MAG: FimV/HubP family polar landmark protein [Halioglobus sp.]